FLSSSAVALFFKKFARYEITLMLSGTYPSLLLIRSNEGELGPARPFILYSGIPRTGHVSGMTIFSLTRENAMPFFFALARVQTSIAATEPREPLHYGTKIVTRLMLNGTH